MKQKEGRKNKIKKVKNWKIFNIDKGRQITVNSNSFRDLKQPLTKIIQFFKILWFFSRWVIFRGFDIFYCKIVFHHHYTTYIWRGLGWYTTYSRGRGWGWGWVGRKNMIVKGCLLRDRGSGFGEVDVICTMDTEISSVWFLKWTYLTYLFKAFR